MISNPNNSQSLPLLEAMKSRKSVRKFLTTPVPREVISEILDTAARAPSGTNTQPWNVYVVEGAAKTRVTEAVIRASEAGQTSPSYGYAPEKWFEPYQSRRRKIGYDLYALLGIKKEDWPRRKEQHHRNFKFFDAPVGLFFTMDSRLNLGSWIDMGIFIGYVMLAARGYNLETCPQAAWQTYGDAVCDALDIPEGETLLCGMSLGYPDWDARENTLVTERESANNFATFMSD